MAKVFTITVPPDLSRKKRERTADPRYVDGQKMLVEAMKYLADVYKRQIPSNEASVTARSTGSACVR